MTADFELPEATHPAIRNGLAYWRRVHPAPGLLPGRQHIDPLQMPRLLPYVWLIEVHPGLNEGAIPRFRFRLVGSHVDLGLGEPKTGRWLHEMEPDFESTPHMHDNFVGVVRTAQISHRRGRPRLTMNTDATELERLMLPLASNGRDVDMLIGFTVFFDSQGNELHPTL